MPEWLEEEVEADFEGIVYRWRCPECENIMEDEEDPRGNHVVCDGCGWEGECGS